MKDEPVSDEPQLEKRALTEEEELEQLIASFRQERRQILLILFLVKRIRDEEKKIFTYFVKVPGLEEQLIDTLCDVQLAAADTTSKTGNIIIMGGRDAERQD